MTSILNEIVAQKWRDIEQARAVTPLEALKEQAAAAPPVRDFFGALAAPGPVRLIAEVKRASPSRGPIRPDADPVQVASTYAQHGASCISVLTDQVHFQGSFDDLRAVRAAVGVPLLCKDFIVDVYQLYQARAAGADAVLLIAECLDDQRLRLLYREALMLGLTPLVELFEAANLARVLSTGATLVGINNRDLRTFSVDLEHTVRLCPQIPDECLVVGESGIRVRADVERLAAAGVKAILVGEALMESADIGRAVEELLGR
ncbi:MAG: indole-3-glycerol phosphate synthase TrpC [Pirellulales bacterium]|nr:indole-3-glycerol phosphate synthase TrpC [Pirellulales bacterium]